MCACRWMYFFAAWPALWMTVNFFTNKLFSFIEWWFYREALFYLDSVRRTARGLIFMCLVGHRNLLSQGRAVCVWERVCSCGMVVTKSVLSGRWRGPQTPARGQSGASSSCGAVQGGSGWVSLECLLTHSACVSLLLQILPWFVLCFWQMWCSDNECEAIGTYKKVIGPDVVQFPMVLRASAVCLPCWDILACGMVLM